FVTAHFTRVNDRWRSREGTRTRLWPWPRIEPVLAGDAADRVLPYFRVLGFEQKAELFGRLTRVDQCPQFGLARLVVGLALQRRAQCRDRRLVLDLPQRPRGHEPHLRVAIRERRDQSPGRRVETELPQRPCGRAAHVVAAVGLEDLPQRLRRRRVAVLCDRPHGGLAHARIVVTFRRGHERVDGRTPAVQVPEPPRGHLAYVRIRVLRERTRDVRV